MISKPAGAVRLNSSLTEDVRENANSVSGKPHSPGSNATNKSCETLRATKRRSAGYPRVYGARIDIFQMRF